MSILLGALILALLLLPGILFRLGYLSLPFSSRSLKTPFLEELVFSLVPSFVMQALGYVLVETVVNVREQVLLLLFLNSDKAAALPIGRADVLGFTGYALGLGALAYALGAGFRILSIRLGLHLKYPFLRIYNEWEIYFEGFILDYPDQRGTRRQADIVDRNVDVLVQTPDGGMLYSGLLEKYVLTKDDKLDRIYLSSVRRRKLSDDLPAETINLSEAGADTPLVTTPASDEEDPGAAGRYYVMPGDYFMIPAAEIKNIHIEYYFEGGEGEEAQGT